MISHRLILQVKFTLEGALRKLSVMTSHHPSWCGRLYLYLTHFKSPLKALIHKNANKTAIELHTHSVLYARKLSTTRRALEKSSCSQGLGLEQGGLSPSRSSLVFAISLVEETHGSSGECVSFSLIDVGSGSTAYVVFLFFFCLMTPVQHHRYREHLSSIVIFNKC